MTALEYGLITALVALAILTVLQLVGVHLTYDFCTIANALHPMSSSCSAQMPVR